MSSSPIVHNCLDALESCLASKSKPIALHEPQFAGNEWQYLKDCLDSGWVSSAGAYVTQFEQQLQDFTGSSYAIATVNGTAALHVSLLLAGVGADDEVLVPSLTFVATANAIRYCGAIPHFIDSSPINLGLDVNALAGYLADIAITNADECKSRITGRRIKAICVPHILGHPVDMAPLLELGQRYHLAIVEDAAEGLGSYYSGTHVGLFGLMSALSFNGNKVITTGGGGAILTQDAKLAEQARQLTTTAKVRHAWGFSHETVAYNYRLPNINAALGCAQLEALPQALAAKRQLAEHYQQAFAQNEAVTVLQEPDFARSNYWLNAIVLKQPDEQIRNELLEQTNAKQIMTRPLWELMHTLPMYTQCPQMALKQAEKIVQQVICLPSSAVLGGTL